MGLFSAMRPRHWLKNLLVFVAPLAAVAIDRETFLSALGAFLVFGLAASATYLINDLVDRDSDRQHPAKKNRAIASGRVSVLVALVFAAGLLIASLGLAFLLAPGLFGLIILYSGATALYSFVFKKIAALDIVLIAGFFVLRILAGGVATGLEISNWLFATSFFAFLSLAAAKRAVEIAALGRRSAGPIHGRGYWKEDREVITVVGLAAGLGAGILLGLYIEGAGLTGSSAGAAVLWAIPAIWVWWVTRLWLIVNRGLLDHDPIDFVLNDRATHLSSISVLAVFLIAQVGM